MNYISRSEFREAILAVYQDMKKLREDSRNRGNARPAEESIRKPISTITKLDPVSTIESRTPKQEQRDQRGYQFWSLFVQWSTFLAVVLYATITACQWQAMRQANEIAVNSNRAWVGFPESFEKKDFDFVHRKDTPPSSIEFRNVWRMKNAGKRPAKIESVETTANWSKYCTEPPDYSRVPRGLDPNTLTSLFGSQMPSSRTLLIPEATYGVTFAMMLPPVGWGEVEKGTYDFCLYIRVAYRDADYPSKLHHTTACRVAVPNVQTFGECMNDYAKAD